MGSKTKKRFRLLWIEYVNQNPTNHKLFSLHKNRKEAEAFIKEVSKKQHYGSQTSFWIPDYNLKPN